MSVCICIFFFWQKNELKLKLLQKTKITDFEKLQPQKQSVSIFFKFVSLIGAVSRISAKVGNYKMPVKLRET